MGISPLKAATVLSIIGVLQILARLSVGKLSDLVGRKVPAIICALVGAGALVWLTYSHVLWMFYLFAVIFGVSWGGWGVSVLTTVGDIFGGRSLGLIMGILEVGNSAGAAIDALVGGFLFDVTGSYLTAFLTAAAMFIAAILITAMSGRD